MEGPGPLFQLVAWTTCNVPASCSSNDQQQQNSTAVWSECWPTHRLAVLGHRVHGVGGGALLVGQRPQRHLRRERWFMARSARFILSVKAWQQQRARHHRQDNGGTQCKRDAAHDCCSEVVNDSVCVTFPVCPAHLPQPSMLLGVGALRLGVAGPGAVLQQAGRQDTKGGQPCLLATSLHQR